MPNQNKTDGLNAARTSREQEKGQVLKKIPHNITRKSHGSLDATNIALIAALLILVAPLSIKRFVRWIGYKLQSRK